LRHIHRNGFKYIVINNRNKLSCDCLDDVFVGVPCRHLMALIAKGSENLVENLPFNKRWRLDYFTGDDQEDHLAEEEKKEEEANKQSIKVRF